MLKRAALLLLAVLVPATQAWAGTTPETVTLADGTEAAVWRPTVGTASPYPLVLFSHGFHGCRDQSSGLMRPLADRGMLVAAVNHADQRCGQPFDPSPAPEFQHPGDWTDATFRERAEQVGKLRRSILAEPGLKDEVDATRIVLVGHSLGGYTVLGLAGARTGWKLDEVAAVVAWAPYTEPYGSGDAAKGIAIPALYEAGSADLISGVPSAVFNATPSPACLVVHKGARHFAWVDAAALPRDLAQPGYAAAIATSTIAFLDEALAKPTTIDLPDTAGATTQCQ